MGILSPTTYGCAVLLRTAQNGSDMPQDGRNHIEINLDPCGTDVGSSHISIPNVYSHGMRRAMALSSPRSILDQFSKTATFSARIPNVRRTSAQ